MILLATFIKNRDIIKAIQWRGNNLVEIVRFIDRHCVQAYVSVCDNQLEIKQGSGASLMGLWVSLDDWIINDDNCWFTTESTHYMESNYHEIVDEFSTCEIQKKHIRQNVEWWEKQRVMTNRVLRTGMVEIPSGTVLKVTDKHGGLHLKGLACACCGVAVYIRKVGYTDVDLVYPLVGGDV